MQPPIARRDDQLDPYAWMRQATKPDAPHLAAERAYYNARIVDLAPTVGAVLAELRALTPDTERSVGRDIGPHTYYRMTAPGQELPKLARKSDGSPKSTILDLAEFGSPYAATGVEEPNPDGVLLAYSVDLNGNERYCLRFRNMTDGADLTGVDGRVIAIPDTYYTGSWAGNHFFIPSSMNLTAHARCTASTHAPVHTKSCSPSPINVLN